MPTPTAPKNPLEIVRALAAVGYSEDQVAPAAAGAFPELEATELALCLADAQAFPAATQDQLRAALTAVTRYSAADIDSAVALIFPAEPGPTPTPTPTPVPDPPTPPPGPQVRFEAIATSMQAGNRGIEFWSAGTSGQVWTLYQRSPGADWSDWEGPGFKGQPVPLRRLAAALQNNGNVLLAGIDGSGSIWSCGQGSAGGDWGGWSGPGLGGQPQPFRQLAASQQGGDRGIELWACGADGQIWTLYQVTAGGAWSGWEGPGFKGQPAPMFKLAAAQQNNGNVMLWTLDSAGRLWGIGQQSPGGDWGGWQGPSFAGQPEPFVEIAASEQGGSRGIEIWALGASGQIWTLYQLTAGGAWSSWEGPGFKGQPVPMRRIAAALQNTGNVLLWGVDDSDRLWMIGQGSPGGDWGGWVQSSMPPLG